jgi:hypothetical protein
MLRVLAAIALRMTVGRPDGMGNHAREALNEMGVVADRKAWLRTTAGNLLERWLCSFCPLIAMLVPRRRSTG